ncbi:GNAT family N-acetyltransferase [Haladaptatus sp. GCM10025707]|uniref:GNAT family N-acetyltransferase n=2 Tax=unclassified Haladaptatus TaxID=2622732 RepID=UPI003615C747
MSTHRGLEFADQPREDYTIRWYDESDRSAVIELCNLVSSNCSEAWFSWKYEQLPYATHVPIIVAEKAGEIAAIRPYISLPLQLGEQTVPVAQLVDLIVHPDHRRQGLMTTLSRSLKTSCWNEFAATFTFATSAARDGILKMQNERWTDHDLGSFVKYERINNMAAFTGSDTSPSVRLGAAVATPVIKLSHHLQEHFFTVDPTIRVDRYEFVPVSTLSSLYAQAPPAGAHIRRDDDFYRWRFMEPGQEFITYVASREETPLAAIVVGTKRSPDTPSTATLVEVLPSTGETALDGAFSSLLSHITSDFATYDHLCATGGALSHQLLSTYGFTRSDIFPLSKFTHSAYLLVCPLGRLASDSAAIERLTHEAGWATTLCVRSLG